jgi:ADP-ribosylation factor-like protein 5B
MGFVLSKIWASLFQMQDLKVVIVGLNNAGKTSILYKLLLNESIETRPTIGSNVEEVLYKNIKFVMWDVGGQESLRPTWISYYSDTSVIIFVVDSTDRDRLPISKQELFLMLNSERLSKAKILVFANKQDLKGSMTAAEVSEFLSLTQIKNHDWQIQPCSAVTGGGLEEGMEWIAQAVRPL